MEACAILSRTRQWPAWVRLRAVSAAALLAAVCASDAMAQPGKTVLLKPGLWRVTSQLWLDGKEVLSAIDAAGAEATKRILEDTRARMSPAERAEFDRNYQPTQRESLQFEVECITPSEASMSPEAVLRTAVESMLEPPFTCSITNARSNATGYSLDYRCRTPANALAEGKARFEATADRRYRTEMEGRGHVVDMQTGKPLDSHIVAVRALTIGLWHAESCGR